MAADSSSFRQLQNTGTHTEYPEAVKSEKNEQREIMLKSLNIKKIAASAALGVFAILGSSELANAQGNRRNNDRQERKVDRAQERAARAQAKADQRRIQLERQRQAAWTTRNRQIANTRYRGNSNYDRNSNATRYRVMRNGSYYNTDQRGAELLRQAVNQGYQQGFQNGRNDRNGNRNVSWSSSRVYQTGTYGYQTGVTQSQYRYYFQQGFQRGYQDGSNSRYQNDYDGDYQYGSSQNGTLNILGTILSSILNLQSY